MHGQKLAFSTDNFMPELHTVSPSAVIQSAGGEAMHQNNGKAIPPMLHHQQVQPASRHAMVPLRSTSNESTFFGAEGLTFKDVQGFVATPIVEDHGCPSEMLQIGSSMDYIQQGDYDYNAFFGDIGKENCIFSGSVDLGDPALPSQAKLHLEHSFSGHHSAYHTHSSEEQEDSSEIPGICSRPESDSESMYTESPVSSLALSSPSTTSSLFEPIMYSKRTTKAPLKAAGRKRSRAENVAIYEKVSVEKEQPVVERKPRFAGDLYTPKLQRGTGDCKEGYCSICKIWLRIKQSSYWYHMNYHHGISASTGKHYERPESIETERIEREAGTAESVVRMYGTCGCCKERVLIFNKYTKDDTEYETENVDLSEVNLMAWYKHAQRCHRTK